MDENARLQWTITNEERQSLWVDVQVKIAGGASDYVWQNFTYSYDKPDEPSGGGVVQKVAGLQPSDLILPAFIMLGGFALISNANQNRKEKKQNRKEWRRAYLYQKGATSKKDLSPYEKRKMAEAEEQRYGKSRFKRRKE